MKMVTARLDGPAEEALAELVEATGLDQSKVVRDALLAANRARLLAQARADSERLLNDPTYLAEIAEVQQVMEDLRAW